MKVKQVKVKVFASMSADNKAALLKLCAQCSVRLVRVLSISDGYILICSSISDADKLFNDSVLRLFSGSNFQLRMPSELKAERTIIIRRVDDSIYQCSSDEIAAEIQRCNKWAVVNNLVKFTKSPGLKITFSNEAMASKALQQGLPLMSLFIPGYDMVRDNYVFIPMCFRCYAINSHTTKKCPKSPSYKICSLCSSTDHTWKQCTSSNKSCINCSGDHSTMAFTCPKKQEFINTQVRKPSNFSSAIQTPVSTVSHNEPKTVAVDNSIVAKTVSCVVLSLFGNYENPDKFKSTLNVLLADNGLPTLCLDRYTPPSPEHLLHDVVVSAGRDVSKSSDSYPKEDLTTTMKRGGDCARSNSHHRTKLSSGSNAAGDFKIYVKKDHKITSGPQLLHAWESGTAVIKDDNDNYADYKDVADLVSEFDDLDNVPLIETKQTDLNKFKKQNFRKQPSRMLSNK